MTAERDARGSELATRAKASPSDRHSMHASGPRYSALDRVRAQELTRRISAGEPATDAWAAIVVDPVLGLRRWRGKESMSPGKIQKTLESFVRRAMTEEEAAALNLGRLMAAHLVPEAVTTTAQLMRGDFGEGRVSVKGRGEDAYEVVEVDGPAARVRLAAAKQLLEMAKVIDRGGQGGTTVNVSQTVNTGVLVVPSQPSSDEWVQQVEAENVRTQAPESVRASEEEQGR